MLRTITYTFALAGGTTWRYDLQIDESGLLVSRAQSAEPKWARLEYCQCPNCPLKPALSSYCPIAKNIDRAVEASANTLSYTRAQVTVTTPERVYSKECATQEGLRSLYGYIMAISGCPHFDWLRPLARFHLPFADTDETLFRVLSVQLLESFFFSEQQGPATCCEAIKQRYQQLELVNHAFINRIRSYCRADASKNALAALDTFVQMFEFARSANFDALRRYFIKAQAASQPGPAAR